MESTVLKTEVISSEALLNIWQGNRRLTRRVIEVFPEKELFEFSLGGMRTFAKLTEELLAIAVPGLTELVTGVNVPMNENLQLKTKAEILENWDAATDKINELWLQMTPEKFKEENNLFGQYNFPAIDNIIYFLENEIHHRGQGYVYLRALGIEPPFFWER